MTTNFTLRDFFVYLLTGCIFMDSLCIIFYKEILCFIVGSQCEFNTTFSFLATIFFIPAIYFIGHLIGIFNYKGLKIYVCIYNKIRGKNKKSENRGKNKKSEKESQMLKSLRIIFYGHRIAFAINKYYNKSTDIFWTECAKLQISQTYRPAEYWYILNEFFSALHTSFTVVAIVAFFKGHCIIGIVYIILLCLTYVRAKQYAEHFVNTVIRLNNAQAIITK
jgi:hypothetical protein